MFVLYRKEINIEYYTVNFKYGKELYILYVIIMYKQANYSNVHLQQVIYVSQNLMAEIRFF